MIVQISLRKYCHWIVFFRIWFLILSFLKIVSQKMECLENQQSSLSWYTVDRSEFSSDRLEKIENYLFEYLDMIHIGHVYIKLYIAQSILSSVYQLNHHPRCLIKVVKFFDKMWDPSCQAHLDRNPPTEFGIAFPCQKVLSMQKLDIWVDSIHTFIYVKYSTEFNVWPIDRSYYCIYRFWNLVMSKLFYFETTVITETVYCRW